jgi:WD40 repeat protein
MRLLQFSPDGAQLMLVEQEHATVWRLEPGKPAVALQIKAQGPNLTTACFSPDGRRIATCDQAGTLKVWNADNGRLVLSVRGEAREYIHHLAFSPDGRWLAACAGITRLGSVIVWDGVLGGVVRRWDGHLENILGLTFSTDGRHLITVSADGVKTWGPWTREGIRILNASQSVTSLQFSTDGRRLLTTSWNGPVKLWDVVTGQTLVTIRDPRGSFRAAALEPNGKRLIATNLRGEVIWYEADTGRELGKLANPPAEPRRLAFSPDGGLLALAGDKETVVWDVRAKERLYALAGDERLTNCVAFSPDGTLLAGKTAGGPPRLLDARTGVQRRTFQGKRHWAWSLTFSPDGKLVATGGTDYRVKVWEVATGKERFTLTGHTNYVTGLAFSRDGKRLASGCNDGTLKLWDLLTGAELLTYRPNGPSDVTSVQFSPDGQLLAVGVWDSTVHLLDARPVTAAIREERAVRALLDFLHTQLLTPQEMADRLRKDRRLSESARRKALELAALYRHDLAEISHAAWDVVIKPGAPVERYRLAVQRAELAVKLDPKNSAQRDILGIAYFRAGHYEKALAIFGPQVEPPEKREAVGLVVQRTFAAMSLHRLGKKDRARAVMRDLRKWIEPVPDVGAGDIGLRFFREAETLLGGK